MAAYTTIDNPELYFQTKIYTGTGSSQAYTLDGDENMQPDMVWIKSRGDAYSHRLYDAVRGVQKYVAPDNSNVEATDTNGLTAFGSDGFTLGSAAESNENTTTHVAWCWKETADAGFDMVLYTGTGSAHTISHSLSAKPGFFILKARSRVANGQVWHNKLSADSKILYLSTTHAEQEHGAIHNSTQPTSSVFTVGSASESNDDGETYIAYLWAEKQGFSKFGQYVGNGSATCPFIYTGYPPAIIGIKKRSAIGSWYTFDNKRDPFNSGGGNWLELQEPYAETGPSTALSADFLSNGFKLMATGTPTNSSGGTYVYMAYAEQPFVNSNGVPCNAR